MSFLSPAIVNPLTVILLAFATFALLYTADVYDTVIASLFTNPVAVTANPLGTDVVQSYVFVVLFTVKLVTVNFFFVIVNVPFTKFIV